MSVDLRKAISINTSGQTISVGEPSTVFGVDMPSPIYDYILSGSGAIAGDNEFVPDSDIPLIDGLVYTLLYQGSCTNAGGSVVFFGYTLTDNQLAKVGQYIARYNGETASWDIFAIASSGQDAWISASDIASNAVITAKINDLAVTTAKINDLAVTAAKIANSTITYDKIQDVTDARMLGNNSGSDGTVTEMTKANVRTFIGYVEPKQVAVVPVSFEASEQANNPIKVQFACSLASTGVYSAVVKAIAATDDAVITITKNGTPISGATITFPASSAINATGTVGSFTSTSFAAGDVIGLAGAKTTAGGKALVSLNLTLT
jgi:hypothetical protein